MQGLSVDFSNLDNFISKDEIDFMEDKVLQAHKALNEKSGAGRNMLGWMDLPNNRNDEEIERIKECATRIQKQCDVFVVVGIGGSYLGAKAIIDLFSNNFSNMMSFSQRKFPQIIFAGNNMNGKYLRNLVEFLEDKDVAINVISKSGKTLEPAITFRILKILLEQKYGIAGAAERIYVTTDKSRGILHDIAVKNEYETFVIPDDVGGRYSVLTPVGLLPMAVANINIEDVLDGAQFASYLYNDDNLENNDCYKYALCRNILYNKGKNIEILGSYDPCFRYFIEWFKQLFGESEGKELKGIFPAGALFSTDLHSMGQMIQEGRRNMFETIINVKLDRSFIELPKTNDNLDELNYLAGKSIEYINKQAFKGTVEAHVQGKVPNIIINMEDLNEYNVGQLIFFFEKACAISGYILGVNPFDQPGVEAYKKNMMNLLMYGNDE